MAGTFDFSGVDSAVGKPITKPGTIGVFKIVDLKFETSKEKQTPYMHVTFDDGSTNFNHRFFLKGKDADKTKKMMSRIQLLAEKTSAKFTGSLTEEAIKLKLVGKQLGLKVTGEVSSNGKGYPSLPFGAFASTVEEVNFLSFTPDEKRGIEQALEAIENSRPGNADSEGSGENSQDYNESYSEDLSGETGNMKF